MTIILKAIERKVIEWWDIETQEELIDFYKYGFLGAIVALIIFGVCLYGYDPFK